MTKITPIGASYRLIIGRITWNIMGVALPLIFGIVFIPLALQQMGNTQFGIITLIWAVTGISSLFDFGLAQSITKRVTHDASTENKGFSEEVGLLLSSLMLIAVFISLVLIGSIDFLMQYVIRVPLFYQFDLYWAMFVTAVTIPLVVLATGLKAITDGLGVIRAPAILRMILASLTFTFPWAFSDTGHPILYVCIAIFILRLTWCVAHLKMVTVLGSLKWFGPFDLFNRWGEMKELFKESGWIATSNVIGPAIMQVDRFYLPSIAPTSMIVVFTVPFEAISRFVMFIVAIGQIIFPAYVRISLRTHTGFERLMEVVKLQLLVILAQACVSGMLFIFGSQILQIWLGSEFQVEMVQLLSIFSITFFVQASYYPLQLYLQASGQSNVCGRLNLLDAFLYVIYMPIAICWASEELSGMAALVFLARLALVRTCFSAIFVFGFTYIPLMRARSVHI